MSIPANDTRLPGNGLQIIQIQHGDRSIAIAWTDSFVAFQEKLCTLFAIPDNYKAKLSVDIEYQNRIVPIEVTEELWPELRDQVRTILLTYMKKISRRSEPTSDPPAYRLGDGRKTIYVKTLTGRTTCIEGVSLSTHTVWNIKAAIQDTGGLLTGDQRLIFAGRQLEDDRELHRYNIEDHSIIHVVPRLKGGWSWIGHLRKRREMHDPLPRAEPLDPSRFIRENFLCLHYKHRTILTSWNADFTQCQAFRENAVKLFEASTECTIYLFIELEIFGNKKMEVDPGTWPLLAGFISDVWASEEVPYPEPQDPSASTPEPIQINTEPTASNRQQTGSTTGAGIDPLSFHESPAQSTSNFVGVPPNSNQTNTQVEQATGSSSPHALIPVTSKIGPAHPPDTSNLDVQPSNSAGVTSKRSIVERIRDKWRRMVS